MKKPKKYALFQEVWLMKDGRAHACQILAIVELPSQTLYGLGDCEDLTWRGWLCLRLRRLILTYPDRFDERIDLHQASELYPTKKALLKAL